MGDQQSGRLRLHLLGEASWALGDSRGVLKNRFAPFVAYVAVSGPVAQEALARMLWGPEDLSKALDSLRQTVRRLRLVSGHRFFDVGGSVRLAEGVDCDVRESLSGWPLADLVARGEFLAGFAADSKLSIDTWIAQQRRHWYARVCDALVERDAELKPSSLLELALRYATRVCEREPAVESAWRARMWLHYLGGDSASAVDAYERLRERLAPSGSAPSSQTLELWTQVQRGASAPVRPVARQPSLTRPPQLVGRAAQWTAIESAWDLAHPVLLLGEGGIGKTRLLDDFLLHRRPFVWVQARKGDQDSPYATLGELLRAVIERIGLDLDAATLRSIRSVLPEVGRARGQAPADRTEIWRGSERVLDAAAAKGLNAVAIDNLHHADAASIEALARLAASARAMRPRLLMAARSFGEDPRAAMLKEWQGDSPPLQVIELRPLDVSGVADLLETLDLVGPAARFSAADLYGHVGGNPFLLLETLREAMHRGEGGEDAALPTPTSAVPLLTRRLLTVRPATMPVLQLAAVLDVDIRQAASALGQTETEVALAVQELQSKDIVRDGGRVHDLMREAVLARLSAEERRHWFGTAAMALSADRRVPRSRVGALWATAERWPEAGAALQAAGFDAGDAGRLPEARMLFRQAAEYFRLAGNSEAEFDALHVSFDAELDLFGTDAAQALVDKLRALASNPEQQARVAIAHAKVSISSHDLKGGALTHTSRALELARDFGHLHAQALSVQALGLAQAGRFEEAIAAGRDALNLERAVGATQLSREIASNQVFALFAASRIGEAITLARPLLEDLEAAGDRASVASMEGNLATLLQLAGDPASSIGLAARSLRRHREVEASASSPLAVTHRTTLGAGLAYVGRFGEAIDALIEAGADLVSRLAPLQAAKYRPTLAHVWLLLGQDQKAVKALGDFDEKWPAPGQLRRHAALSDAARMAGRDPHPHLRRLREAPPALDGISLMQLPWIEWSSLVEPSMAADRMRELEGQLDRDGRPGAARTATLMGIERLCEIDTPAAIEAAAASASRLRGVLQEGLIAQIYLPAAWETLAKAFERAGSQIDAQECLAAARDWVLGVALPNVPESWRDSFLERNPVNRRLLG